MAALVDPGHRSPMTVDQLAAGLRRGEFTARQVAQQALASARLNRHGAFVSVTEDMALRAADRADRELAAGVDRGPLQGIPVAVKDVIDVGGLPTGVGTSWFGHRQPVVDSAAWARLGRSGAVLIGKTRLPELALDILTPGVRNPVAPHRTSGGSSGGSAAAIAEGTLPIALGTDTGGSVRIPAALTGIVGLRSTHAARSLRGLAPLSPSQDTIGLLGRTVRDCLLTFLAASPGGPAAEASGSAIRRCRIGIPVDLIGTDLDSEIAAALERACSALAAGGCSIRSCLLPLADLAPGLSYLIMTAEASAAWRTPPPGAVGGATAHHLEIGRNISDSEYLSAGELARELRAELVQLFAGGIDAILLPTTAVTAAPLATSWTAATGTDPALSAAYCRFTALASVTGLPAISVPVGVDSEGLPIGLQLVAGPGRELTLCRIASRIEVIAPPAC